MNIVQIFKKGEKGSPGKIVESLLRDHILDFLEGNAPIRNSKNAFRKRRNCLINFLEFCNWTTEERDKENPMGIVYLDFMKTFESLPHKRL